MFEDSLIEVRTSGAKKTATVAISTLVHVALVGVLIVIPLLVTEVLPAGGGTGFGGVMLAPGFGAAPPPPPPPLSGGTATHRSANTVEVVPVDVPVVTPSAVEIANPVILLPSATTVPERIAALEGAGEPGGVPNGSLNGVIGGVWGGVDGGKVGGVVGSTGTGCGPMGCGNGGNGSGPGLLGAPTAPPPPPVQTARVMPTRAIQPPPPPPVNIPKPAEILRVGGDMQMANCLKCPIPDYPALARIARVSDTVVISARISKQGTIEGLTVVRGHQLLRDAAESAVRQWRYRPTMLNGEPVEVQTTISISFVFK